MARAVVEPNPVVEPIPVVDPNPCNSNCGYYLSTVIPIPIPAKNGIITALLRIHGLFCSIYVIWSLENVFPHMKFLWKYGNCGCMVNFFWSRRGPYIRNRVYMEHCAFSITLGSGYMVFLALFWLLFILWKCFPLYEISEIWSIFAGPDVDHISGTRVYSSL